MTDIVEGLRELAWGNPPATADVVHEAADEIERLRAALKEIDTLAVRHVRGAIGLAQKIARTALRVR
jgi:4-alpha-glucanotransferase